MFTCRCGSSGPLSDHEIAADGTVTPSLYDENGCGFHEMIVLEGYREKAEG